MVTEVPPMQKAAFLGSCAIGLWAFAQLLGEKELLRNILQPLVLAFMVVGVLSLFVEWVEIPLKILTRCCLLAKWRCMRCMGKRRGEGSLVEPLRKSSAQTEMEDRTKWFESLATEAIVKDAVALQYAPESVKNDFDVVLEAVKQDPQALWYASYALRDSETIVTEAVERNGMVLACVSDRLRADTEIVKKAIANNGRALQYVNKKGYRNKHPVTKHQKKDSMGCMTRCKHRCKVVLDGIEDTRKQVNEDVPSNVAIRIVAVVLTFAGFYCFMGGVIELLWDQLKDMQTDTFVKGLEGLRSDIIKRPWFNSTGINVTEWEDEEKIQHMIQEKLNVGGLAASMAGELYKSLMQLIMCTIYSIIMLIAPLKEISSVFETVRSYFARKTASNLIYTVVAFFLLHYLKNPLTPLLVIFTFFISYIPEIGAFITCVLPAPFFLLDGNVAFNHRLKNCLIGLVGMIINKFAVGNGFEAVIMGMGSAGSHGGDERQQAGHTHPVLMIAIVLFGGTLWGATGTLFAVPATWLVQAYVREQIKTYECAAAKESSTNKARYLLAS